MKKLTSLIAFSTLFIFACSSAKEENKEKKTEEETTVEETSEEVTDQEPPTFTTVGITEFDSLIAQPCTILDVRTPEETALGMIKGAVEMNINGDDFANQIQTLDKTKPVCVYCKAGGRSASAADMLTRLGYTVYNLDGGYDAWKAAGK